MHLRYNGCDTLIKNNKEGKPRKKKSTSESKEQLVLLFKSDAYSIDA